MLLSVGVDSSLALQLLKAAGHEPTAFYLQIWFQEDFRNFWDACPWEEDLEYCRKVCGVRVGMRDTRVCEVCSAQYDLRSSNKKIDSKR